MATLKTKKVNKMLPILCENLVKKSRLMLYDTYEQHQSIISVMEAVLINNPLTVLYWKRNAFT